MKDKEGSLKQKDLGLMILRMKMNKS